MKSGYFDALGLNTSRFQRGEQLVSPRRDILRIANHYPDAGHFALSH